ncbi:hypothetical protein CFN78_12705 [Amycolatopsis antarctica]|uniref:IrrE N-terminal-like domain-containing protein n=1 Tax=Amycolatopsis antarctica TaxID=1854586 RepID=A0A263D3Y1_9PSEU|nr:hypothetical protein [Amycolatopsis antarctica]OZM73071.1 hypothetical protein CFN78_12705 [Amycolatopsis antarctica]
MKESRKERELRRRCRRELQALDIEPPLRVDVLCGRLGERRGRPIRLVPYPLPVPGPFGLWIATDTTDYVLYQQETSKTHQDHIILHEVGHILADHQSDGADDDIAPLLTPDIMRNAVRRALRRTSYDDEREREAELVATIILEWASVLDRVAPRVARDAHVQRVQTALGDRQGWQ